MADTLHQMAPHHLPSFLPGPDGSDPLFTGIVVVMLIAFVGIGTLYLRLHALPEQMAHGANRSQFQLVAILGLLALFTHQNLFWVAALLLAVVVVPDYETPLKSIAASLRGKKPADAPDETLADQPDPAVDREGVDHA